MNALVGTRAIVTGGAQGMGEAAVRALAAEGAHVASFDVSDEGERVAAESTAAGPGQVLFRRVDVSKRTEVEPAFAEASRELGGLDVLVHVAGVVRTMPPEDIDDDTWDFVMNINVRGTMLTNQAAFRLMKPHGQGAIINFGSVSGLRPEPRGSVYSASKGAVHSWTRSVATAWGPSGIRVNAILPIIATPMYERNRASMTDVEREADDRRTLAAIPLGGRYGDPMKDLAPVVVFFASEASRFITGQLIPVDGGLASVR